MKPGLLALAALVLAVSAVTGDVMLLDVAVIRNGWWMAALLGLALVIAAVAVIRRLAWFTAGVAFGVLVMTAADVASHFQKTPAQAPAVQARATFPDTVLAAHDGTRKQVSERWKKGPLVVVLFRGHW